ncbi:MAG: acyltransferase domain-containing protein, partial [Verrucomicrobiota bacterium]
ITKWGGFIHDFKRFDAQFFGISPREALRMDPQQRWMLETAWESLEDAGLAPAKLRGSETSVYVGIASNDYANVAQSDPRNVDVHTNSGSTLSIASNRISYLFDLKGPAVSVDTACSSALVAINLGCESIWSGQAKMAIAGGCNALLTPDASIGFSKATMLSPTGQCFAFDDRANGYVRGEGAGMFVIKPLSAAQRDGDRIYCTIKAAVINQDGNTSSMTVPGVETQAEMLRIAYSQAGLEPKRVRYMEAHGTGTPVGDPIETRALGTILSQGRDRGDFCLIGSCKTNVGHLESGSGVAGLAKAALILHHDQVPPNLNFKNPNPDIPFDEFKLKVATELQEIPKLNGYLPVVGVNSFGFGGTNAHIVLEAAPDEAEAPSSGLVPEVKSGDRAERPVVMPLSGRGDDALRDTVVRWRRFLKASSDESLAAIGAAAGLKREHHDNRVVFLGNDRAEIIEEMTEWLVGNAGEKAIAGRPAGEVHPIVFVFTGQGAQWWRMGQDLIKREPVFRNVLEEIDRYLKPLAGWSLIDEMTRDEESSQINRTNIAQPAIFGLQIALAELWKSWGIVPSKVVGHSVGEVAAAYVAGAYTLEDAVTIIYHRSRLQDQTGGKGRMVAVGISQAEADAAIEHVIDQVQVAVVNSPTLLTLAGDTEPLEAVAAELEEAGKFVRWLRIDYAFHTHQMEPIKDELLKTLSGIKPRPTTIPYISTVTGGLVSGEKLDGEYWWQNVRETVLFAPAISGLIRSGEDTFLELGPHPALQNPILECLSEQGRKGFYFHSCKRKTDETDEILTSLATLHNHGYELEWESLNQASPKGVRLPTYAWQGEDFWLESDANEYLRCADLEHPLLGLKQVAPIPTWQFELDPRYYTWLDDHRFWDSVVFPASGYGEIGIALARKLFPGENYVVEDLEMKKALFVSETKVPTVEVAFDPETRVFRVYSSPDHKEWDLNAEGVLRKQPEPARAAFDFSIAKSNLTDYFDHEEYYSDYSKAGYQFQPLFQHLQQVWRKEGECLAEIVAPEGLYDTIPDHHFHPAVLDACFHTVKGGQIQPDGAKATDYFYLPAAIGSIRLHVERPPLRLWGHARVDTSNDREYIIADIDVYDDSGALVAEIFGFRADRVEQSDNDDLDKCLYEAKWEVLRLKGTRISGSAEIPPTAELVKAANANLPELYAERGLSSYFDQFMPAIDRLSHQAVINAWLKLGWTPVVGQTFDLDQHLAALSIASHHRRLIYAHCESLSKSGFLKSVGEESWEVIEVPVYEDVEPWLDQIEKELPAFKSEAELQRLAAPHLAEVLNGEIDPIDVLFPGGSSRVMETFYRDGADFPVINEQFRAALEKAVEGLPERRAIRILEVGGGTGSLTSYLLDSLPADRTEYVFTDNGPTFLQTAQDRFGEKYPFVEFKLFDLEKDPTAQGFDAHSFDIVIASNVIHATADLRLSLLNLRHALAEDGVLMFVEVNWNRAPLDNVFGLLSGWWRFTDTDLRKRSALLTRPQWENLLTEEEFREATSFIASPDEPEDQQGCFIARAPHPVELPVESEEEDAEASTETLDQSDENPELPLRDFILVTNDEAGIGASLIPALRDEFDIELAGQTVSEMTRRCDELLDEGRTIRTLVNTLGLDHLRTSQLSLESLDQAQDSTLRYAHELTKYLNEADEALRPKVVFVTRGTMPLVEGEELVGLASAPITGFLRVANNEHADYHWTQIDLDPAQPIHELEDLSDELRGEHREDEVGFRGHHRYVRRVHRVKPEDLE